MFYWSTFLFIIAPLSLPFGPKTAKERHRVANAVSYRNKVIDLEMIQRTKDYKKNREIAIMK